MSASRKTASLGMNTLILWTNSCRYNQSVLFFLALRVRLHCTAGMHFFFLLKAGSLIFVVSFSSFLSFARRWQAAGPTRSSSLRTLRPPRPCLCWRSTATCTTASTTTSRVSVMHILCVLFFVFVLLFLLLFFITDSRVLGIAMCKLTLQHLNIRFYFLL